MPMHVVTFRRWQVGIAFAAVVLAFTIQGALLLKAIRKADTARDALCFQRHDLDIRIAVTQHVLKHHPHAHLVFAIPRALLVSGLHRDKVTRVNLSILDCKESK